MNGIDHSTRDPPDSAYVASCSFEHFLSQWSNGWLVFDKKPLSNANLPYKKLGSIVFTSRISEFRHAKIEGIVVGERYHNPDDIRLKNAFALQRLASGDWTAFPPVSDTPYNVFNSCCLQMWDSPPMEDSKPQNIEKTSQVKV